MKFNNIFRRLSFSRFKKAKKLVNNVNNPMIHLERKEIMRKNFIFLIHDSEINIKNYMIYNNIDPFYD